MDLRLQPNPEVEILPANQGIVSRKEFFVTKKFEKIQQYFFPGHFIRNWRPKVELLYPTVSDETAIQYECDFNRDIQNCFVEDNAEEVFLRTPPPCFVVIGKFGASVSKLSKQLADEFGSVLIQVDDVINQLLKTGTETAKVLETLLRLGVSLTLNFILALLSYVAHTAEARHRGYVLCGLPCIPEEYDLPVEQQFNYLFTWDNKPTVFINVVFDDEDLIKERTNTRYEVGTEGPQTYFVRHTEDSTEGEDDVEEDSDEEAVKESTMYNESDIDISPSRPWIQLPRDEESQVWHELELFDNKIRPAIELLISRVDPQYFITVDSRLENEIDIVLARLSLLQIWKVPIAVPFITPKSVLGKETTLGNTSEGEEEAEGEGQSLEEDNLDTDIKKAAKEPPQTAFLTLFTKNTISQKFRWELSHYNYICPVSLREGEIIEGKSEFAVVFMKYIFFLKNEDSMLKFIKNPRAYVLPVRPNPLCRFVIIGYPYSGKTTIAKSLGCHFNIPVIDANNILRSDLERKKNIYREFCRQKAECRETIRLNAQAWQEWRVEEERRICLIEEWIGYIQTLLSQRIEQFYSSGESEGSENQTASSENVEMAPEGSVGERQSATDGQLTVHGVAVSVEVTGTAQHTSSPSDKIIKAMKHEDFNFNDPCLEVEANLFFSSLWNTFSHENNQGSSGNISRYEEAGEDMIISPPVVEETTTVDWCSLLPPQSLSSFLMGKIPYTTREKRQSFKIFLEAASKAYWEPSKLKTEFAKWRLPCYMNIPLCEVFFDNPVLLLKYVPEWLKERPMIPDPVDPMHPKVIEAGRQAFYRAGVVTVKQNKEEVAVLLRDAIEKAEREGMRVTGEVISPGGWVMDNMPLDLDVWKNLGFEGVFPDHVYILLDTDPEHRRIINTWCELNRTSLEGWNEFEDEEESQDEFQGEQNLTEAKKTQKRLSSIKPKQKQKTDHENILEILAEIVKMNAEDDYNVDEIFENLLQEVEDRRGYTPPTSVDTFTHHIFENCVETWCGLREETANEEALMSVQTLSHSSSVSFFSGQYFPTFTYPTSGKEIPLGLKLQMFTDDILNAFKTNEDEKETKEGEKKSRVRKSLSESIDFFINLLTLPQKLESLKEWLISVDRGHTIHEIEITEKTPDIIVSDIQLALDEHFLKRPRELEDFELEEIQRSERLERRRLKDSGNWDDEMDEDGEEGEEELQGEDYEEEDIRIFGESGRLCVVNLEVDILLVGKREFALRYYGKLYYFWDEIAKEKFLQDPQKYAPYYSVIRGYPPLRIYIVGPQGSGKTTLATSIANQCSLNYLDYADYIRRRLIPYLNPSYQLFDPLADSKLLLSQDYNAAAKSVLEKFMSAPYKIRKFWFENPVYEEHIENKNRFRSKLINLNKAPIPTNFPALNYECIEAITDQYDPLSASTQEDFSSMKALESLIRDYYNNTAELSDYCIEKTTKPIWSKEPYISQGFVLDGFPLRYSDMKHVIDNNWIPDLVVEITLPEETVIERCIDAQMEAWDTQLKQEMIEEKALEDTLLSVQTVARRFRQNELLAEMRAKVSLEKMPAQSTESVFGSESFLSTHGEMQAKVVEIVKEEFPDLSFNPVFETYEAGRARIIEQIKKCYKTDVGEIEKIKDVFKQLDVPWLEIDSLKEYKQNERKTLWLVDKIRKRTNLKGEFAFTMKMDTADKLLKQGYYFLSKFGRWCPVQVYRMKNPINMFRPFSGKGKITPIAYRNYIYFVGGENEKLKFIEDPVKYTFNEPQHPNIPLRVAIIGPPKSGKSILSSRLGRTFDMKVVTMGSALRFVLEEMPKSTLAKTINNYLRRGCFLPLKYKVEALLACLNDPSCATQGFVLDGIPFDAALTQSLAERGKLPFVIICLVADADFGKKNRKELALSTFRLPYKNRVNLDLRYNEWQETYKRFAQWNQNTYNNLYEVNAKSNVVDIFYQAYDIIRKSFFGILYYVQYCVSKRALPLRYLCVGQHEYELRKSSFHNNCPVCWLEENRLSHCPNPPPRSGLVQYLQYFYWICSKHMEKFLKHPKIYVPPEGPPPPTALPKIFTKKEFQLSAPCIKIHGNGRCPVTKVDFPGALAWEGSWDFAAIYSKRVYLCKNSEMLDRFLARPWRYCKADTVFEVNRINKSDAVEQLAPPKMTSLPPIGFLEQTVADAIHTSLQIVGTVRPVYPKMNPTATGCTFLGLSLKLLNKNSVVRQLAHQYYDFMLRNCKAHGFRVPYFKRPHLEIGQGDYWEQTTSNDSESSDENFLSQRSHSSISSDQCGWLDLEAQADKKMWSAKAQQAEESTMRLTEDDELLETPEVPKAQVILKYQTYALRRSPLPPIENCLTYVYSVSPPLEVRKKFNYNTLYQPSSSFTAVHHTNIMFQPDKEFDVVLYKKSETKFESQENLWKGKRTHSEDTFEPAKEKSDMDPDLKLMIERFIPRFQLLDKLTNVKVPSIPTPIEEQAIIFNPHRDYTYTLLLSEFFLTTHLLRCYEWNETYHNLEYTDILDRNLGLTTVQVEYLPRPHIARSISSRKSIQSYMDAFDVGSTFVVQSQLKPPSPKDEAQDKVHTSKSSLINFIQVILLEKLDEVFTRISLSSLSYDSFEVNLVRSDSETIGKPTSTIIREVLPYPPLPWDLICTPYYAYSSVSSVFKTPTVENIAHERHFSLLDGIIEPNDEMKFLRYPTWVHPGSEKSQEREQSQGNAGELKSSKLKSQSLSRNYFVFDFFKLYWTSFLTYPFSWAYNVDVKEQFCHFHRTDLPICIEDNPKTEI